MMNNDLISSLKSMKDGVIVEETLKNGECKYIEIEKLRINTYLKNKKQYIELISKGMVEYIIDLSKSLRIRDSKLGDIWIFEEDKTILITVL